MLRCRGSFTFFHCSLIDGKTHGETYQSVHGRGRTRQSAGGVVGPRTAAGPLPGRVAGDCTWMAAVANASNFPFRVAGDAAGCVFECRLSGT